MREVDAPGPLLNTLAPKSAMPIQTLPPSLVGSTGVIRLHVTSDVPIVGTGFSAVISTLCPAGTYSTTGSTVAVPCRPCPAGRYSSSPIGATTCVPCAATAPYSPPLSSSIDACVACAGDVECADGVGAALCPGTAAWVGWSPSPTAPVTGTCLALLSLPMTWAAANSSCTALGLGARLMTSPQVCLYSLSCSLDPGASVPHLVLCCMPTQESITPGDLLYTASASAARGLSAWVGAVKSTAGWAWVDGTNASALSCATAHCPLWTAGAPTA